MEDIEFEGVPARITSPARTVVDCFRFRNRIGHDVPQEALVEQRAIAAFLDRRTGTIDGLWEGGNA